MNVLLKSLSEVEVQFGKKATMAPSLLDMVAEGEKAYGLLTGTMDNGWDVTVGLFNGKSALREVQEAQGHQMDGRRSPRAPCAVRRAPLPRAYARSRVRRKRVEYLSTLNT